MHLHKIQNEDSTCLSYKSMTGEHSVKHKEVPESIKEWPQSSTITTELQMMFSYHRIIRITNKSKCMPFLVRPVLPIILLQNSKNPPFPWFLIDILTCTLFQILHHGNKQECAPRLLSIKGQRALVVNHVFSASENANITWLGPSFRELYDNLAFTFSLWLYQQMVIVYLLLVSKLPTSLCWALGVQFPIGRWFLGKICHQKPRELAQICDSIHSPTETQILLRCVTNMHAVQSEYWIWH